MSSFASPPSPAADRSRLEQLCRSLLRPAVAQDRLRLLDDGRIVITLKTAWADGTRHLVFAGRHRPNDDAELAELVGDPWVLDTVEVVNHFAAEDADHVLIGLTPARGTVVRLDRPLVEADLTIATGLVEPHFMAGWSGGRKVIAPGWPTPRRSPPSTTPLHGRPAGDQRPGRHPGARRRSHRRLGVLGGDGLEALRRGPASGSSRSARTASPRASRARPTPTSTSGRRS